MALRLYIDFQSQPCRAIVILCRLNNIPHKIISTQIIKQEQRSPEYTKINPMKKVPSIVDEAANSFALYESHAIMRYICRTRKVSDNWYPNNPQIQANIDKYLDWHHLNLRINSAGSVFNKVFKPLLGLEPLSQESLKELEINLQYTLKTLDQYYLKNSKWVAGTDQMTIADLSCACELAQLLFLKDFDFNNFVNIKNYLLRFFENTVAKDVHKPYFKFLNQINPEGADRFQTFAKL